MKKLEEYVKSIPDYPKPGIIFRDITTILQDADGFALCMEEMIKKLEGLDFDVVIGTESRGFIFGAVIANLLHKPLVLARKQGKLPRKTVSQEYELEYGKAVIEMHADALTKGQRVVIVDDLIATGGTVKAAANLAERLGAEVVKIISVIELTDLKGREFLKDYNVDSLISYDH